MGNENKAKSKFKNQQSDKNIVGNAHNDGIKEARDEDDNIIISDSTSRSIFPPQFRNVFKIQGHVWLQMLHICQNYIFIITVMARSLF